MRNKDAFFSSLSAIKSENGHESCPVHGPLLIYPLAESTYTAVCLTCGVIGPEREAGWDAKLAFDESFPATG